MSRSPAKGTLPVTSTKTDTEVRITLRGEFTFKIRQDFREAYCHHPGHMKYVVDMAGVTFMDSSAMGMLLVLREHAGGEKAHVRLINLTPKTANLLKLASLNDMFILE
ncbi:MAG: STAS domain-containing protein [Magnetococcus sp. YQC-5]